MYRGKCPQFASNRGHRGSHRLREFLTRAHALFSVKACDEIFVDAEQRLFCGCEVALLAKTQSALKI